MTVKQKLPTFEHVRWTGSNAAAVQSFVDTYHYRPTSYSVEDGVLLFRDGQYLALFVPEGSYVLYGPSYGADHSQASLLLRTDDEFTAQYDPA